MAAITIPISRRMMNGESTPTFDARILHGNLEAKKDFSSWIKAQIKRARLVENEDYLVFTQEGEREKQGLTAIEYHLTLNAGKHIGMISGTKRGWEVREYFIAKEREALSTPVLDAYPELRALADMARTIGTLVTQTAESRAVAEQAQRDATAANVKADLALSQQLWLSLREYAYSRKLTHQLPLSVCKAFGTYLSGYCLEHDIPVRDVPVAFKAWKQEHAYHVELIDRLLPKWLKRQSGQIALVSPTYPTDPVP